MKRCSGCKIELELGAFSKNKARIDGLQNICKACDREHYTKNKDKALRLSKEYNLKNKHDISKQKKSYYTKNKETIKNNMSLRYVTTKSKKAEYGAGFYIKNKSTIIKYQKDYQKERKKTDVNFKLRGALRSRLLSAIKNNFKGGSAVADLGCSISELKVHLESQFQSGMNWDNWGLRGWHIDHILPLAAFNLADREQLLVAVNYKNLRPMWAKDNLMKGAKIA